MEMEDNSMKLDVLSEFIQMEKRFLQVFRKTEML
jgi:hypothetical protein